MITKALRNKIAAGVVAATLVGGSVTVFASPDAAAQLRTWYNTNAETTIGTIESDIINYVTSLQGELKLWFNGTKSDAVNTVKQAGTDEIKLASNDINSYAENYKKDLTNETASIKTDMTAQFAQLTVISNQLVDETASYQQDQAENAIHKAVGDQTTASLSDVNTQVTAVKDNAVSDLTITINNAKKAITDQLTDEQASSTAAIQAHVDSTMTAGKTAITDDTNALVKSSKDSIKSAGDAIVTDAEAAMDKLVNDITN